MKILTIFEQIILTSIHILKDEAFGISIRQKAKQISGKKIMYGALYNVLDQLYKKGYVIKTKYKPSPEEGGHARIYYSLTSEGEQALREAYTLQKTIWNHVPGLTKDIK